MDRYLAKKDIVLNSYMKVQSIEAVKRCVMNNLGMAGGSDVFHWRRIEKRFAYSGLKRKLDDKEYHSFYIYHKNRWISPQMELAMELLKKYLGKEGK